MAVLVIGVVGCFRPASSPRLVRELPSPSKALWKPEPSSLLSNSALRLTTKEREAIRRIDAAWKAERRALLAAFEAYRPPPGGLAKIRGSVQEYSALSRRYDTVRTAFWNRATSLLTRQQRAIALRGAP